MSSTKIVGPREWRLHHVADWCCCVLLVVADIAVLKFSQPHCRTFEWTDPSINYPAHNDTFPTYSLALMAIFAGILFILFYLFGLRCLRNSVPGYGHLLPYRPFWSPNSPSRTYANWMGKRNYLNNREWNVTTGPIYSWISALIFSLVLELFCSCILKVYVGRLRPDFLSRLAAHGYTASTTRDPVTGVKVPNPHDDPQFFCDLGKTITSSPSLKDGRLSFPSGHSSTSFAVATTLVLFLFAHLRPFAFRGSFLRLCVCLSPFWLGLICAASRTRDNKHNFSDILAGSLIGFVSALIAFALCFRVTGGAAMVVLERADDDVEYDKAENYQATLLSSGVALSAVEEQAHVAVGEALSTHTPGEKLSPASKSVEQHTYSASLPRQQTTLNIPSSREFLNTTSVRLESESVPLSGCACANEIELNENTQAVPWI